MRWSLKQVYMAGARGKYHSVEELRPDAKHLADAHLAGVLEETCAWLDQNPTTFPSENRVEFHVRSRSTLPRCHNISSRASDSCCRASNVAVHICSFLNAISPFPNYTPHEVCGYKTSVEQLFTPKFVPTGYSDRWPVYPHINVDTVVAASATVTLKAFRIYKYFGHVFVACSSSSVRRKDN